MKGEPPAFADEIFAADRAGWIPVDPTRPYAFFVEPENIGGGRQTQVATVYLTNRECPYRCIMCDLWRHTTRETIPVGAIPRQIRYALNRLPTVAHIKLYNSGNFFDRKAIPIEDYAAIASAVGTFETVIVENHPNLTGVSSLQFRDLLSGQLEIALGLETVHEPSLQKLNKRMTLKDFADATRYLNSHGISVRAFVLLWAPFMQGTEGIEWTIRSVETAFELGVDVVSLVPLRSTTAAVESLRIGGWTREPTIREIEQVVDASLALAKGRLFVDLWDMERFYGCPRCSAARHARLRRINLTQCPAPPVTCVCDW